MGVSDDWVVFTMKLNKIQEPSISKQNNSPTEPIHLKF